MHVFACVRYSKNPIYIQRVWYAFGGWEGGLCGIIPCCMILHSKNVIYNEENMKQLKNNEAATNDIHCQLLKKKKKKILQMCSKYIEDL